MKTFIITATLVFLIAYTGCSKDKISLSEHSTEAEPTQVSVSDSAIERSFKGWELYSWADNNGWQFSFLPGTNRMKTYEEVINNNLIVTGEEELKRILVKFPKGEEIFWAGKEWFRRNWQPSDKQLQFPPQEKIEEIKLYCSQIGLNLNVVN